MKSSKDLSCCNERWVTGDLQHGRHLKLVSPSLGLSGTVHGVTKESAIDPLGDGAIQGFLGLDPSCLACKTLQPWVLFA